MNESHSEHIDEQLTAYLDGELSPAEAASVERDLVGNPTLRKRLADLRQAYDLLDEVPETPHKQSFTQSTISMVIQEVKQAQAEPKATEVRPPAKSDWFTWPRILAIIVLSTLAGFFFGGIGAVLQARNELANLSVIANLPGLQDVGEWKVAEELAVDGELIDYLSERYSDRSIPSLPESLWSRRSWVAALNPVQVAKLENGREQLLKLPRETVARLGAIQSQVDQQPNSENINRTIRVVGHVLDAMPNRRRQELSGATAEQRIRSLREHLHFRAAMFYAADLTPEDTQAIEDWSRDDLLPVLMASMPFLRREVDLRTMLLSLYSLRPIEDGFRIENQDELLASLAAKMSPFAKKLLGGIDRNDQLIVVSTWIVPEGINNVQRLIDTYDRTRPDTREAIDLADPNQGKRLLRDRSRRPSGNTRTR